MAQEENPKAGYDDSSDPYSDLEKGDAKLPPPTASDQGHKTSTVAGHPAPDDLNAVWWDGEDDPENPYNWTAAKKWSVVAVLAFLTLLT